MKDETIKMALSRYKANSKCKYRISQNFGTQSMIEMQLQKLVKT